MTPAIVWGVGFGLLLTLGMATVYLDVRDGARKGRHPTAHEDFPISLILVFLGSLLWPLVLGIGLFFSPVWAGTLLFKWVERRNQPKNPPHGWERWP